MDSHRPWKEIILFDLDLFFLFSLWRSGSCFAHGMNFVVGELETWRSTVWAFGLLFALAGVY